MDDDEITDDAAASSSADSGGAASGVSAKGLVGRVSGLAGRGMVVSRSRGFRIGFGSLLVALAVWAVASEWQDVRDALKQLDARWLVVAILATIMNVTLAGMVWRTVLADLGSKLSLPVAARIFFVGQLGKYLPGSVWPVVMQSELGRDHKVPRRRTATATMVAMLLSVTSALVVVLLAVPLAPKAVPKGFGWAVLLVIPAVVLLHPAVLGWLVDRVLRLVGREGLPERTSIRGTLLATLWAVGSWVGAGLQVWALAVPLGAPADLRNAVLLIGGYALAWAVGFVVIVAPAGAGVREVILGAVLAQVLDDRGAVVVVVLLSRVLFTLADLSAAGTGLLVGRRHREL
jgi:uncharacterized membrane protein YbhN (UPF0104 family)